MEDGIKIPDYDSDKIARIMERVSPKDNVNHPSHYTFGKFEVIEVLMDWFSDLPLLWQVGKYIARAKHKNNMLEDLKKARWYLDFQIKMLEDKK